MRRIESRQVSWWPVHEFVQPRLDRALLWPLVGTPAWCALDDQDPSKWAALLDAAQRWALHVDTTQEQKAEAAQAISSAEDWKAVAQRVAARDAFYAAHPWLMRVPS